MILLVNAAFLYRRDKLIWPCRRRRAASNIFSTAPLFSSIDQTVRELKARTGIIIPSINIWKAIPHALWVKLHGELAERAGGHGADPITSLYWHLFPDLMRPDLQQSSGADKAFGLETIGLSAVSFQGNEVLVPLDAAEVNPHGLIGGDSRLANPRIGAAFADHIVSFAADFVTYFKTCDPRSLRG